MCEGTYTHTHTNTRVKTEQYRVIKAYKTSIKRHLTHTHIHTYKHMHTHTNMKTEKGSKNTWEIQLTQSKRNVNEDGGGWSDHAL